MNVTARRAWRTSNFNQEDQNGYFKIFDELQFSRKPKIFDPNTEEWGIGNWPDGRVIIPFEILHPN